MIVRGPVDTSERRKDSERGEKSNYNKINDSIYLSLSRSVQTTIQLESVKPISMLLLLLLMMMWALMS